MKKVSEVAMEAFFKAMKVELVFAKAMTSVDISEDILGKLYKKTDAALYILTNSEKFNLNSTDVEILEEYLKDQQTIEKECEEITEQQLKGIKQMYLGYMNFKKTNTKEIDKFEEAFDKFIFYDEPQAKRQVYGLNMFEKDLLILDAQIKAFKKHVMKEGK